MNNKNWLESWFGIEPDSIGALVLFWALNGIFTLIPWIGVTVMWIFFNSTGKVGIDQFHTNIWPIVFFTWPFMIGKMSWRKVAPEEIGAIYFSGLPLLTVAPGPYFVFPGIFELDLDTNSNMVYLLTAMDDTQLSKEFSQEDLKKFEVFRLADVTTGSPEMPNWEGISTAMQEKIEKDLNHKQVVLKPSLVVTLLKTDYISYRKNVLGKNAEGRKKEVGRQLMYMAKSTLNTEFKKRTYAMLIYLQTTPHLDDQLRIDTNRLVDGYGENNDQGNSYGNLGLKVISAKVMALGAPQDIHDAVNLALAEKFKADRKELEGEGDKRKAFQTAEGDKMKIIKAGEGKAEALRVLLQKAEEGGVNPTRIAELQAEITAFGHNGHFWDMKLVY